MIFILIMDILFIKGIVIKTYIGIYKWEKYIRQKLILDIQLSINNKKSSANDDIRNCINYQKVIDSIHFYFKKNKFNLLEKAAEETAKFLLKKFDSNWVKIKMIKSSLLLKNYKIGVIIKRKISDKKNI